MFNYRLWLTVVVHSTVGTCNFYSVSVLANLEPFVKSLSARSLHSHYGYVLTDSGWPWIWAFINSSLYLGALVAAPLLKPIVAFLGRRNTVMLGANLIFVFSATMQFAASPLNCVELLVAGRFLWGTGFVQSIFLSTFVSECAPLMERGRAGTAVNLGARVWSTLAVVATLHQLLGSETLWYFALLLPFVPAYIHLLAVLFIPESPKGLYAMKYHTGTVVKTIRWYQGENCEVEKVLDEYAQETAMCNERVTLLQILKTKRLRWPFLLCVASWSMIAFSGNIVANAYSTGVIESLGIAQENAALFTVAIVQGPCFLVAVACVLLVECCGRRLLLLAGILMAMCGQICVFIADYVSAIGSELSAVGLLLMLAGCTLGPMICMILPGELCPVVIRPLTVGCCSAVVFLLFLVSVIIFPPLHSAFGGLAILAFFVPSLLVFIFLFLFLPETRGRTVEEVLVKWLPVQ